MYIYMTIYVHLHNYLCTFTINTYLNSLVMRNAVHKSRRQKQNTHFIFNIYFSSPEIVSIMMHCCVSSPTMVTRTRHSVTLYRMIKSLCASEDYNPHTTDDLKMSFTEYIRNVDHRAILNTVYKNTVRRVNKCVETGGGHFGHYL